MSHANDTDWPHYKPNPAGDQADRRLDIEDYASLLALKELQDYAAANPEYSTEALVALEVALTHAEDTTLRTREALAGVGAEVDAARRFHARLLGARPV